MSRFLPIRRFAGLCLLSAVLTLLALSGSSCAGPRLEPGGPYVSGTNEVSQIADLEFFRVDRAFSIAYNALDGVFDWEMNNEAALWAISHDIKHGLDKLRPEALKVRNNYIKARDAYLKTPTPQGLSELQTALNQIERLNNAASVLQPQPKPAPVTP